MLVMPMPVIPNKLKPHSETTSKGIDLKVTWIRKVHLSLQSVVAPLTRQRQVWCCLQVKLCDPYLSTFVVVNITGASGIPVFY